MPINKVSEIVGLLPWRLNSSISNLIVIEYASPNFAASFPSFHSMQPETTEYFHPPIPRFAVPHPADH